MICMNQILMNKNDDENNYIENLEKDTKKRKSLKHATKKLKYIFGFSSCFVFVLLSFYIYHLYVLNRNKKK